MNTKPTLAPKCGSHQFGPEARLRVFQNQEDAQKVIGNVIETRHHFVEFQALHRVLIEYGFYSVHELVGVLQTPVLLYPQYFICGHNSRYEGPLQIDS